MGATICERCKKECHCWKDPDHACFHITKEDGIHQMTRRIQELEDERDALKLQKSEAHAEMVRAQEGWAITLDLLTKRNAQLEEQDRLLEESRKVVAQLSAAMNHLAPETGPVRKLAKENIDFARAYLSNFEKRKGETT